MKDGWKEKTLKGVCDIRPPKREASQKLKPSDKVSFVPMENHGILKKDLKLALERRLSDVRGSYTYFADNDVLLAKITPCFENGKLGIARNLTNGIGFGSSEFVVLRSKGDVTSEFLFYYLSQDKFRIAGARVMSGAVGHKRVPKEYVEDYEIPLPPLEEQKRIVAILDEAFEGIEKAQANAEKNLANARELFESQITSLFTHEREGWITQKLYEAVFSVSTGPFGSMLHKSDYIKGGIPIVNPINITDNEINPTDNKTVSLKTAEKLSAYTLDPDYIVIGRRGEIGRCAVVQADQAGWVCGTGCFYIKPSKVLNPYFLSLLLRSSKYRMDLERLATGATMKNLSNSSLKNLTISFPKNVEEQEEFVIKIDELRARTGALAEIYEQKLKDLAELKQSLLQKAFSGELTSSNIVAFTRPASQQQTVVTRTPEFAAHVIAYGYHWHEGQRKNRTYGHVKTQKFLHLAESVANVDMGRSPRKCAAGPHDAHHMQKAEDWAKTNRFFEFKLRNDGKGYDFVKLANYSNLIGGSINAVKPYQDKIQKILSLLLPMKTREAEVLATVHAAWNNLLLDNAKITEKSIIREARENWTDSKRIIPESEFRKAITTIRNNGIVPDGTAKRVSGQESLSL